MSAWYIPITILPGICLLILSTSNIMLDLSREVKMLIEDARDQALLIQRKLDQLKLINRAMVFLYLSVSFFVISALLSGIGSHLDKNIDTSIYTLFIGILCCFLALISLMVYSFRAVRLRQDQFLKKC